MVDPRRLGTENLNLRTKERTDASHRSEVQVATSIQVRFRIKVRPPGHSPINIMRMKTTPNRRDFFRTASAGLTAAGLLLTPREQALAQNLAEKNRLDRIASCSYPIRYIFKSRNPGSGQTSQKKQ